MSRVGKKPIAIPKGVQVAIEGDLVKVKGPKGELSYTVPENIAAKVENESVIVNRANETKDVRAKHGLARNLIQNLITGVSTGFTKNLVIQGVGYRADVKGKHLNISLGFSHPVEFPIPEGIDIKVDNQTKLSVEGIDRCLVGQVCAEIRSLRPPEPYQGKGIRYADEHVRRKAGKAAAGAQGA